MKGIGVLSIPNGIICKKETLGQQFYGKISGYDVKISFPTLNSDFKKESLKEVGMSNPLKAPINKSGLTFNEEGICWGYPTMAPDMNVLIKHVLIEFDCDKSDYNGVAQKLYANVEDWTHSFKHFIQLLTKQQLGRERKTTSPGNNLQLLFDKKYVENQHPTVLYANFYTDNEYASCKDIEQAIVFASSEKKLLLEYQMLLSAYNARKEGENRQAIIDACSAVEICLMNWIKNYCNKKGFASAILTDKYKSLFDRFQLIKHLDNHFPDFNFRDVIVKPRNDVAHNRNVYPTDECTDQLIELVEEYLAHYHISYY